MADVDDDMAVLLQDAIAELKASRKQAETIARQNQQLIDQNSGLMKEIVESNQRTAGRKQPKPKIVVSVQTKVI